MNPRIGRLFTHSECYYIYKCRIMLSHLTGEAFVTGWPAWNTFTQFAVEAECYCERLKVSFVLKSGRYQVPPEYSTMYNAPGTLATFAHDGAAISAGRANVLVMELPPVCPDEEIKDSMAALYAAFIRESGLGFAGGPVRG